MLSRVKFKHTVLLIEQGQENCEQMLPVVSNATMTVTASESGLFMFLMGLAWRYRYSMPLLLSCSVALLGNAWMFQVRVQTHRIREADLGDLDYETDSDSWTTSDDSTDSWETIREDVTHG